MNEKKYKVLFNGKMDKSKTSEEIKKLLIQETKISPKVVNRLFRPISTIITQNINFQKASNIIKLFKSYGLILEIEEIGNPAQQKKNKIFLSSMRNLKSDTAKFNAMRDTFLKDGGKLVNEYGTTIHKNKGKNGLINKFLNKLF